MRSKTSKARLTSTRFLWKEALGCSEPSLTRVAQELSTEIRNGDCVSLEGELGTGKSTFARALLLALRVSQPPEGSPTFAIAHEYGAIAHVDFYRLKSEGEIDDAGIPAYFWERNLVVICEWISLFPDFQKRVLNSRRSWIVKLDFNEDPSTRNIEIEKREPNS